MPPSYSPCPRPILKRTAASVPTRPPPADEPAALLAIDPSILSPLVRFPPHQALAHTLGSAIPYDRSPIVVAPNRCALPERGCPGRTYSLDEAPSNPLRRAKRASLSPARGRHLHPRAVQERERCDGGEDDDLTPRQSPRADHFPLPPLVPDLSSESSEESDGIASPPPELYSSSASHHHGKMSLEQSLMHLTLAGTNAPSTSALSFLPHPPSPRVRPSTSPVQPSAVPNSYPYAYVPYASNPSSSSAHHHPHPHMGTTSPVRSRSPASPTRSKPRKARPAPIPIPQSQSQSQAQASAGPTPTGPASPRHLRERSRERRTHTHTHHTSTRTPRSFGDASCRIAPAFAGGFAVEDGGCLGGF